MNERNDQPERPRVEPEILPPAGAPTGARERGAAEQFVFVDRFGQSHRIFLKRPSPFAVFAWLVVAALVAATLIALVLGFMLLAIPLLLAALALAMLSASLQRSWGRLRQRFRW